MPRVRAPVRVSRVYRVRDAYTREELGSFWEIACARENSGNFRESRVTREKILENPHAREIPGKRKRARACGKLVENLGKTGLACVRAGAGAGVRACGRGRAGVRAGAGGRVSRVRAGAGAGGRGRARAHGREGFVGNAQALFFRAGACDSFFFACVYATLFFSRARIAYISRTRRVHQEFLEILQKSCVYIFYS